MLITDTASPEAFAAAVLLLLPGKYQLSGCATSIITTDGDRLWMLDGRFHRRRGPAVERANGRREWWINGSLHRDNGPAVEDADGAREWWVNGKLHRNDGPAVIKADGSRKWYLDGKRTRAKRQKLKAIEMVFC